MIVRPLRSSDYSEWFALRSALWPECQQADNESDARLFTSKPHQFAVFVSESDGYLTGFLEASLRGYADGCATSPVGYVEGWFVLPKHRLSGVGRAVIEAAEDRARARGCAEMASDALLDNTLSHQAHQRVGYTEVERAVRTENLSKIGTFGPGFVCKL